MMSGESWEASRAMLARNYADLVLLSIAGHSDEEMSFSAGTGMGECLLVGRKAGTAPGYNYTEANKNSGVTWDDQSLDTYLSDPRKFIPGTKMLFPGVKDADDRAALIAYLKQQK